MENSKITKEVGKTIATKVPINTHEELIDLIQSGAYLSISDFLREAIREELKRYKINNIRDIDYIDAKSEILSYFIKYQVCYLDEIALDLELEFELVAHVLKDLLREGRIAIVSDKSLLDELEEVNLGNNSYNFIKLDGKRLIIESKSKKGEFISLRVNSKDNSIVKSKGEVLTNGVAILSKAYSFVK